MSKGGGRGGRATATETSTGHMQEDKTKEWRQGGLRSSEYPRRPTPEPAPTGPGRVFGLGLGRGRANTSFF